MGLYQERFPMSMFAEVPALRRFRLANKFPDFIPNGYLRRRFETRVGIVSLKPTKLNRKIRGWRVRSVPNPLTYEETWSDAHLVEP